MFKILIAEDDPLISRMYQKIFTLEGYDVTIANDGQEALNQIPLVKPAIILLDIMMPKLNGVQVLEKIKQLPEVKDIPVVMLTNLAGQQDIDRALELGALKYIVKSEYEPKQIVNMVKEILAAASVYPPSSV